MKYPHRNIPCQFWFLAIVIFLLSYTSITTAAEIKTLVIVSHPYPEQSVMTKGLEEAARAWLPPLVFQSASRNQLPEYQRLLVERLTD
ncbi:hypothetical protein QTP37_05125 [Klebsiella spallanzanii]|nr:hypothetical protein [Klebsiella spallanzanii]MDM4206393.1 hypothetical protein [Klebsiella spallanzanii]